MSSGIMCSLEDGCYGCNYFDGVTENPNRRYGCTYDGETHCINCPKCSECDEEDDES